MSFSITSFKKKHAIEISSPGKINRTLATITIDTGARVFIVRRKLVRAEDIRSIPETIKLKSVTGESTPIMNEAAIKIHIVRLRIRHRAFMASMEDNFILGIDLISNHGLTVDPVEKVLRLCTEKLMRNCIEVKPVISNAYQTVNTMTKLRIKNGLQLRLKKTKRKTSIFKYKVALFQYVMGSVELLTCQAQIA